MVLFDFSGKVIRLQNNINTGEFTLKREGLEKGIYLIELKGRKTYRGKLIVE
jgi:hypothetical protein